VGEAETHELTPTEKRLFSAARDGVQVEFESNSIDRNLSAEAIRHFVLGLPGEEKGGGILLKAASLFGLAHHQPCCPITGVGVAIKGAIITGRLKLDSAIGMTGGPICPLSFTDCEFRDGFSGRHAHFSRLNFTGCTFAISGNPVDAETGHPIPTIDLSAARLDSPLDMDGVRPKSETEGLLWIRAPGLCVGGHMNLSRCRLRAPASPRRKDDRLRVKAGEPTDALDLTRAEINGDLKLLDGSHILGRINARGARIGGDLWLNGAKVISPETSQAILLQGARIGGFLSMRHSDDDVQEKFECEGRIDLTAAEVGLSLIALNADLKGSLKAPDLTVRDDLYLHARVAGEIDLEHSTIGGSLDLAGLQIRIPKSWEAVLREMANPSSDCTVTLSLKDGRIGRALRLKPDERRAGARFQADGIVDLTNLTCDTLDDEVGQRWGKNVRIRMNHFIYRQTGWLSDRRPQASDRKRTKPSYRVVSDWIQAKRAEGRWPWLLFPRSFLSKDENFWDPWQLRRNWIYQQYDSPWTRAAIADPFLSNSRHQIYEDDYNPQPFEQAISVARAEGREDFATHFEMHKQRLEWRFFNRRVRWPVGFVAIILSSLWTSSHAHSVSSTWLTLAGLVFTLGLMVSGSWIRRRLAMFAEGASRLWERGLSAEIILFALWLHNSGWTAWIFGFLALSIALIALVVRGVRIALALAELKEGGRVHPDRDALRVQATSSKVLTWFIYWIPAIMLFAWTDWYEKPFHYFVGFTIFGVIRLIAVFAHAIMRFGFGYLRRPVRAVATLIVVFLIGWWGSHLANVRNMLVVNAEPIAPIVGPESHVTYPQGYVADGPVRLMGSRPVVAERDAVRELSCAATISEPLFALDVLVPIVDLGEERRCDVRRIAEYVEPERSGEPPRRRLNIVKPDEMHAGELLRSIPDLPLNDHRFWWWMKALYAIFGWIIVSLSILTFAQVNKIHAEPPHEHK